MPPIFLYLLKVSISLSVVWLFYQLFLRRLTFYTLNRWYLLGYSVLAFFIPLINVGGMLVPDGPGGESSIIRFIPVVDGVGPVRPVVAGPAAGINGWKVLVVVLAAGSLVLLIRTAVRGWSLYRLRKSARLIEGGPFRIYQVDAPIIPFSFGHSIYINQDLHSGQQWSDIILHEYVHIRQRHTLDILLTELICMLNWYNPFSWLMRWSIRQNLEFIADQQVLGSGVDRKGYQYHLLTVLGESRYRLANNFNFSSLKKRIVMMNKMRSTRLQLLKFLFIVPLAAVLLVAFRDGHGGGVAGKKKAMEQSVARDTTGPGHVLYVWNGNKMPRGWTPDDIPSDSILSIDVIKGEQATRLFGERGVNGVIALTTKKYQYIPSKDPIRLFDPGSHATPLCIVDGKEVSVDSANKLDPRAIQNVTIFKSDEHTLAYGEKGKNGVVIITLKKAVVIVGAPRQQVRAALQVDGEPMTITADTLRVSQP